MNHLNDNEVLSRNPSSFSGLPLAPYRRVCLVRRRPSSCCCWPAWPCARMRPDRRDHPPPSRTAPDQPWNCHQLHPLCKNASRPKGSSASFSNCTGPALELPPATPSVPWKPLSATNRLFDLRASKSSLPPYISESMFLLGR